MKPTIYADWCRDDLLAEIVKRDDRITGILRVSKEKTEEIAGLRNALDASNEARAMVGERWLALDAALREIKRCPGRSCQTDRIASIALEKHGQRVIEILPGGGGGFSSKPSSAEKQPNESRISVSRPSGELK